MGATPRLKLMPSNDGISMDVPFDRKTRLAHVTVSGSDTVHKIAIAPTVRGPEMSQKIPRAKISLVRSLCRQKTFDINSCGRLKGEGKESLRIARLRRTGDKHIEEEREGAHFYLPTSWRKVIDQCTFPSSSFVLLLVLHCATLLRPRHFFFCSFLGACTAFEHTVLTADEINELVGQLGRKSRLIL